MKATEDDIEFPTTTAVQKEISFGTPNYVNRVLKCKEDWKFIEFHFQNKACEPYSLRATIETSHPIPQELDVEILGTQFKFKVVSYSLLDQMLNRKYSVLLSHRCYFLLHKTNSRVFNMQNLKKIIGTILGQEVKIKIKSDLQIPLFVQYEEKDLDFLNRILLYYNCHWFCNCDGSVTVTDNSSTDVLELKDTDAFFLRQDFYNNSSKTAVASYNPKNPNAVLLETAGEGKYTKNYFKSFVNSSEGKQIANFIQSQNIESGNWIHAYNLKTLPPLLSKISFRSLKEEIIHCIDISNNYLKIMVSKQMPKFNRNLPVTPKFFRATVDNEKHLQYTGDKVQITLPFDRETKIFATVMQSVCAKGNQSFLVPSGGDEVALCFLDCELTEPMIVGSFFNASNPSQFLQNEFGYIFSSNTDDKKTENKFLIDNLEGMANIKLLNQGNFDIDCGGSISIIDRKGNISITIQEGDFNVENKNGNFVIQLSGDQRIKVKKLEVDCQEISFKSDNIQISSKKFSIQSDEIELDSKKDFEIKSDGGCKLSSGTSSVSIKPEAIKLASGASSMEVKAQGAEIKSGISSVQVQAQGVKITGTQVEATGLAGVTIGSSPASQIKIGPASTQIMGASLTIVAASVTVAGTLTAVMFHGVLGIIAG